MGRGGRGGGRGGAAGGGGGGRGGGGGGDGDSGVLLLVLLLGGGSAAAAAAAAAAGWGGKGGLGGQGRATRRRRVSIPLHLVGQPLLARDLPLSTIFYTRPTSIIIFSFGCGGTRHSITCLAGDLLVFYGTLIHAGPASKHTYQDGVQLNPGIVCPRIHSIVESPAAPQGNGNTTDKCSQHADGEGWRPTHVPASRPFVRRDGIPCVHQSALAILQAQGWVILPALGGAPELSGDALAFIDTKCVLPAHSQQWRPIFNDESDALDALSLRQVYPIDQAEFESGMLSKYHGMIEGSLEKHALLMCDPDGPFAGVRKWVEGSYIMRHLPGCQEQTPHADVAVGLYYTAL
eukprot:2311935-Prymnesium_polylepis.1